MITTQYYSDLLYLDRRESHLGNYERKGLVMLLVLRQDLTWRMLTFLLDKQTRLT